MEQSEPFSIFDVAAGDMARVVDVAGEIDMGTGPAFQRGLLRAIGASRGGLIVDLRDVPLRLPDRPERRRDLLTAWQGALWAGVDT